MFEEKSPKVFALPCGVDFPKELLNGLKNRMADYPPEDMARVTLIVNTARMKRRIEELFHAQGAGFTPKILLLSDLSQLPDTWHLPRPAPALRRRLELAQLVRSLLDQQPDLAARSSAYDLADSLANLMEELHDQDVSVDDIKALDVSDLSGHWARAQLFFDIAAEFVTADETAPDATQHMRQVVETLSENWGKAPPSDPVILAGSTASRGTTMELAALIARLPKGAVVLPGFDFEQTEDVWQQMSAEPNEDHPQFRFVNVMDRLEISSRDIQLWSDCSPPSRPRNALTSLAFRPAPVTDAWMREGPRLQNLNDACKGLTLIEAASPLEEAQAVAIRLRQAVQDGQKAALVTPDRMLTRRVSAALQRWGIVPDDSAGVPLHLSPPGRLLRMIAALDRKPIDTGVLLALLKHPLCHSGADRGNHLRMTRELELHLRTSGQPFPDGAAIQHWADARDEDFANPWAQWVFECFCQPVKTGEMDLSDRIERLLARASRAASGSSADDTAALWQNNAGLQAEAVMQNLMAESSYGGTMTAADFADLLGGILSNEQVRDRDTPHPNVMIWGTLEARVGGADLVILSGLNEGSWPEPAKPDPWMNRPMRKAAGLTVPERRIGLSAHDFQQALASAEVVLTRAAKSDEAETVTSRWVNRICNLLSGLENLGGHAALADMRKRGQKWLDLAASLEQVTPVRNAPRPSPAPPIDARPRRLSITEIKKLIRDPYAIYAKHVLRLRPLRPMVREPDALLRGTVLHKVFESYVPVTRDDPRLLTADQLNRVAEDILSHEIPWPSTRVLWQARLAKIAERFVNDEKSRQSNAVPSWFETNLKATIPELGFTISGQADRIDLRADGQVEIYDYKTGAPPTQPMQKAFDKQLLITAAMVTREGIGDHKDVYDVARATFLGIGSGLKSVEAPIESEPPEKIWEELTELISAYMQPDQGFTARRMMQKDSDVSDYDHLARYGEWDRTVMATRIDLT